MQLFCGIICRIIIDSVIYWRYNNLSEENKSSKRNEKREICYTRIIAEVSYEAVYCNEGYWEMPRVDRGKKPFSRRSGVMGSTLLGDADGIFPKIEICTTLHDLQIINGHTILLKRYIY